MTVSDIKQRVASLRSQVATHKARVEQAELAVQEKERNIQATYGTTPEQLGAALVDAEREIQDVGQKLLSALQAAGA